jgi:hypothetical protein
MKGPDPFEPGPVPGRILGGESTSFHESYLSSFVCVNDDFMRAKSYRLLS